MSSLGYEPGRGDVIGMEVLWLALMWLAGVALTLALVFGYWYLMFV